MARRSRMSGVTSLRKKFRRFPDSATKEVQDELRVGLNRIERDAIGLAPVDQGDMAASITTVISRDGLSGVVGPGVKGAEIVRRKTGSVFSSTVKKGKQRGEKIRLSAVNEEARFNFFVGYWNEFGTKGAPDRNIPPQTARPFMSPAYDINRRALADSIRRAINKVIDKVAKGG